MPECAQHTVPCVSRDGWIAPWALEKASGGVGGGASAGGFWPAGLLGVMGLGRQAMPCTIRVYAPRLAAAGVNPSTPRGFDHVSDHSHFR